MSKQDYDQVIHNPPAFFESMHNRPSPKGSYSRSAARLYLDDMRLLDRMESEFFALSPFSRY